MNILLVSAAALLFCLSFILLLERLFIPGYQGVSPFIAFLAAILFSSLLLFSRAGFPRLASYVIVGILFAYIFYANYSWGPDLPITWILYCFLIIISGILISSRFAFLVTSFIASALIFLTWMLNSGNLVLARGWKQTDFLWGDIVAASIAFTLIAIFSWLANQDLRASLLRARSSEAALKNERDSLEIKVEERTKQLKEAQEAQIEQMTRFAEFGQLASGIMHDLANPLTSMSINLQLAKDNASDETSDTGAYMDQALQATKRMEELVQVARQQFRKRPDVSLFVLGDEIEQATQLLQSKARPTHVRFDLDDIERIETLGSPLKFNRVMVNLFANAIEAYNDSKKSEDLRLIQATCHEDDGDVVIEVIDRAGGIDKAHLEKIFEPFFTTKKTGSGIGLPTVKEIIKNDFGGTIEVESKAGKTRFEIRFPIRKDRG